MFHLTSWDLAACTEVTQGYDSEKYEHNIDYDMYIGNIDDPTAPTTNPPLSLKREDLQEDFEKSFTWEEHDNAMYGCPNDV